MLARDSVRRWGMARFLTLEDHVRDIAQRAVFAMVGMRASNHTTEGGLHGIHHRDGSYASLHRVCVADESKGKGVAGALFAYAFELARELTLPSVRIDTHPGNLPMRRAMEKAGFLPCGEIRLADGPEAGDLRVAFEKVLG